MSSHVCVVAHLFPTLCDLLDCGPPGFSVYGSFKARILEWLATFLLQGIFPIGGSNLYRLCLPALQWIIYLLSHWGRPYCTNHIFQPVVQGYPVQNSIILYRIVLSYIEEQYYPIQNSNPIRQAECLFSFSNMLTIIYLENMLENILAKQNIY